MGVLRRKKMDNMCIVQCQRGRRDQRDSGTLRRNLRVVSNARDPQTRPD